MPFGGNFKCEGRQDYHQGFQLHTSHSGEGPLCETKPIRRGRAAYRGPVRAYRSYLAGSACSKYEIPATRDEKITPYGATTNGSRSCETNPIRRRRSERQVLLEKRVMSHSVCKRRWENEANCPSRRGLGSFRTIALPCSACGVVIPPGQMRR